MQYIIILNIIFIIGFICYWKIRRKQIEEQYLQSQKEKLNYEVERAVFSKREQLKELQEQHTELLARAAKDELAMRQIMNQQMDELRQQKIENLENQIAQQAKAMREQLEVEHQERMAELSQKYLSAQCELEELFKEVEAYRAKQEAINQEILRRRELKEKTDFYRVCLSDEAIMDITELQIVRRKLKKPEILDKIIYDTYVAKPVLEMVKRVLQNSTCSGIYKITCQETKEIYIGKSTDIKNRWQQHCKTAFNCGTIASSLLHRKMQQYGIENFTFELLEAVPKDKLTEREKFYIDFYKTKETGLNERSG